MTRLVRYAPNREMRSLQREIDRLFDGFFGGTSGDESNASPVWSPRTDLAETEDTYLIELDVPGISKDDLEINFHDGTLTVSGERTAENRDEKRNYVRVERSHGRFYRSFTLPQAVNHEAIEAGYQDGVLTVTVPKAEESKPRRIEIR